MGSPKGGKCVGRGEFGKRMFKYKMNKIVDNCVFGEVI